MEIVKLKPALKSYIWGGQRLQHLFDPDKTLPRIAEAWVLSAHPDGPSIISEGKHQGRSFIEYIEEWGHRVLGDHLAESKGFPILIKFIDAKEKLSIQVHPDDHAVQLIETQAGKNELWYVMDAAAHSYLYYGVKRALNKQQFIENVQNNRILADLSKIKAEKGASYYVKAGTIHGIGEGCLICEIQQNSNSTFRIYDFERTDDHGHKRALHIHQAAEVAILEPTAIQATKLAVCEKANLLASNDCFTCHEYHIQDSIALHADSSSFHSIVILNGAGRIYNERQSLEYQCGDSFFIPANAGQYILEGQGQCIQTAV